MLSQCAVVKVSQKQKICLPLKETIWKILHHSYNNKLLSGVKHVTHSFTPVIDSCCDSPTAFAHPVKSYS